MPRLPGLVVACSLTLPGVTIALPMEAAAAPPIEPGGRAPQHDIQSPPEELATTGRYIVVFDAKADLRAATEVDDFASRGKAVLDALQTAANEAQQQAIRTVVQAGGQAEPFWIRNTMVVEGSPALAEVLADLPGVEEVRPERIYPLIEPVKPEEAIGVAQADPGWNVAKIGAPDAWDQGVVGGGIVVGSIDSGVDGEHPALVNQYRGNLGDGTIVNDYNWFDPTGICGDSPCDNVGHGTHTVGTILGGDGPGPFSPDIGVAPGAEWIASKGCEDLGCSETALLTAGQFMLAPTDLAGENPDPAKRPDIVSNSWGGGPGDPFYQDIVVAWRAAGIIPVFSSGNPGPTCGEGGSPGDYLEAVSVGATDADDVIADFSGRGPSVFGKTNPDVTAPGVDVVSSVPGGGYEAFSGTSMAAPAVSGTLALLLSAAPELIGQPDAAVAALGVTALDIVDLSCGGDADGDPNNVYGEGRIDADAAVALVASGGTLEGTVTGDDGSPLAATRVSASNGERIFSTFTDDDGDYRLLLAEGMYTVSASLFGYADGVVPGVEVIADATVTQDVVLSKLPTFVVSGRVRAAEDGAAVARATVTALGVPVPPVRTSRRGFFNIELPLGHYTLEARAGGCTTPGIVDVNVNRNRWVQLSVARKIDDFGHGCSPTDLRWRQPLRQTDLFGDDSFGRLRLPFDFPFYDESYRTVYLSTNGFLSFENPEAPWIGPEPIPAASPPNAAIYPLWSDLVLGESSEVGYRSGGRAPDRWFTLSIMGATQFGGGGESADFQVKLWESGTIDVIYRNNTGAPGNGSTSTIGLEAPGGEDAFTFSFRQPVIQPGDAYRFEVVPTGVVSGVVTNVNDGLPVAGVTVEAATGGRSTTTDEEGRYSLRLVPGRHTLLYSASNYVTSMKRVRVTARSTRRIDVPLDASAIAIAPTSVSESIELGESAEQTVTITNVGTAPLDFLLRERDQTPAGISPPPVDADGRPIVRTSEWGPFELPAALTAQVADPGVTFDGPLDLVIDDPDSDAIAPPELTQILGGADGAELSIQLDFAAPPTELGGYFLIDADQDVATGVPPDWWAGLPTQELGVDYVVDLFGVGSGEVALFDAFTFELIAILPAVVDGSSVRFDVPTELMVGADDAVDVGAVVGDFIQPTDWAPDEGKGTIEPYRDAPWISTDPSSGTVDPGASVDVTVTLDGIEPGVFTGIIAVSSNDPRQPQVPIDVSLDVQLPAGFGTVNGTITNARTGGPVAATIVVDAERDGAQYPIERQVDDDGTYELFGPAGTWPVSVSADGYESTVGEVTIPEDDLGTFDVALQPLWPAATLDGGPLEVELVAGDSTTATLTLGNVDGLTDLTFSVHELAAVLEAAPAAPVGTASTDASEVSVAADARVQGAPVLLLEEALPWGFTSFEEVFDLGGIVYDVAGSEELADLDLSGYEAVFVANDQPPPFYATIEEQIDQLAAYAEAGGYLWMGVAGWGANGGEPAGLPLPGGGNVTDLVIEETNDVVAPDHPVVAGVPNPFFGSLASHTTVEGEPDGTVIATTPGGETTLVEYQLGSGRVLVVAQPVEWGWAVGEDSGLILLNSVPHAIGFEPFTDVPWLDVAPSDGLVPAGDTSELTVSISAAELEPGTYEATVIVQTDDPTAGRLAAPVTLEVTARPAAAPADAEPITTTPATTSTTTTTTTTTTTSTIAPSEPATTAPVTSATAVTSAIATAAARRTAAAATTTVGFMRGL